MLKMNRKMFRKRRLVIFPRIQIALAAYSIFASVLTAFCQLATHWIVDRATIGELPVSFPVAEAALMTIIALLIGAVAWGHLLFTNRLVGPIYRIMSHMDEIAKGANPSEVRLRDKDEFRDLAARYNAVLERLRAAEGERKASRSTIARS